MNSDGKGVWYGQRWLITLAALVLTACGGRAGPPQPPVNIVKGDTCAVCGMYIRHYPGPRGEAYMRGATRPLKFGSTRDFFAYVTRADVKSRLGAEYVQNTARIDWKHPSNSASSFINARKAWYVAFQPLGGAMGPTLASFAKRSGAEAFIEAHGGKLMRYADVTPAVISQLAYTCPKPGSPMSKYAQGCVPAKGSKSEPKTGQ